MKSVKELLSFVFSSGCSKGLTKGALRGVNDTYYIEHMKKSQKLTGGNESSKILSKVVDIIWENKTYTESKCASAINL